MRRTSESKSRHKKKQPRIQPMDVEEPASVTEFVSEEDPDAETIEVQNQEARQEELSQSSYSDQELSQEIQKAIEKEESIPALNKDIHITVRDGIVTLKGSVFSEHEKMTIGDKAVAYAGFGKVNNQLEVMEEEDEED